MSSLCSALSTYSVALSVNILKSEVFDSKLRPFSGPSSFFSYYTLLACIAYSSVWTDAFSARSPAALASSISLYMRSSSSILRYSSSILRCSSSLLFSSKIRCYSSCYLCSSSILLFSSYCLLISALISSSFCFLSSYSLTL